MIPRSAGGRRSVTRKASAAFILLLVLIAVTGIAGGASRAEVPAQVVVRAAAWIVVVLAILVADRPRLVSARPIAALLGAASVLALAQLVPLPPAWWQALPGRAVLVEAAAASGQAQPWRPLAMVPAAAVNAAGSLIVPWAVLLLVCACTGTERRRLPGLLLLLVVLSALVGLVQFAGTGIDNPLVNDSPGEVGGTFANRNHFALLIALGCALAPVWACLDGRPGWKGLVALGLLPLFWLVILATGSRAGLALGVLTSATGLAIVARQMRGEMAGWPRWAFPALVAAIVAVAAAVVLVSVLAGRAVSIDRIMAVGAGQDMRGRGLATVIASVRTYLPFGSGLGSFDAVFRMHEPLALLKPTFFNHAHNDWLEIALDAGIPGILVAGAGLAWWAWRSIGAWGAGGAMHHALPKLGSVILLAVFVASLFDYPARTPLIMAVVVIAGVWLSDGRRQRGPALPEADRHL